MLRAAAFASRRCGRALPQTASPIACGRAAGKERAGREADGKPRRSVWSLILLFALTTPLGLALGTLLQQLLSGSAARLAEALFDAVDAATFVYVATFEVIGPEFRSRQHTPTKLAALTLGLAVMALVALWL